MVRLHEHVASFRAALVSQWQEFRGNRRLQWVLGVLLVMLLTETGFRWGDYLGQRERILQALQIQYATLQGQSRDELGLTGQLASLQSLRAVVDQRLWVVSSEATGQARLQDWLREVFRQTNVSYQSLVLAAPKSLSHSQEGAAGLEMDVAGLREFRATVVFLFTPANLEGVLAALEGGEPLVQVESLVVSRQSRRVEMTVRLFMEVNKNKAASWAESHHDQAHTAGEEQGSAEVVDDIAVKAVIAAEKAEEARKEKLLPIGPGSAGVYQPKAGANDNKPSAGGG